MPPPDASHALAWTAPGSGLSAWPANPLSPLSSPRSLHSLLAWMPRAASLHGPAIDALMRSSLLLLLALCVAAQLAVFGGLILKRRSDARFSPAWQAVAAVALAALFAWMTLAAEHLWRQIRLTQATAQALRVEVTGMQFQWYFRYPGPDGVFGRLKPELIDAAGGNPLGLDPADPHGQDDIVSSALMLPANRQVELELRAQDVIHGFFVPAMRIMQNATPGQVSTIHFTPTLPGRYEVVCTQLCGLGHYRMHASMQVVSAAEFAAWMARRESAQAGR